MHKWVATFGRLFWTVCKYIITAYIFSMKLIFFTLSVSSNLRGTYPLVWWQLWNLIVRYVKFNSLLHPTEHSQRIFWYLVRLFDWELKISIIKVVLLIPLSNKKTNFREIKLLRPWKLAPKTKNVCFLLTLNQKVLLGIQKSI